MKILLVDVDSTIPNIALMRLSTWLQAQGYSVDYQHAKVSYYPNRRKNVSVDCTGYNQVYASTIFEGTWKNIIYEGIKHRNVLVGGTGINLQQTLTAATDGDLAVETAKLDYNLYPDNDIAYGFITRGCPKSCYFCFVPKKEGKLFVADTVDNIIGDFKKVEFLDNNILHYEKHEEVLQELVDRKISCEFNQGLDIMKVTDTNAALLAQLKYKSEYTFAFDAKSYQKANEHGWAILSKYITKPWKCRFFVYTEPLMPLHEDVYFRIKWCYDRKALPYLMRDISCWDDDLDQIRAWAYVDLAAWCNQPNIFKKMNFKQFMSKRHPKNKDNRQNKVGELVCGKTEWNNLSVVLDRFLD